jgi:bifunctional DNA-binding transcriptional regulator/antitoxin component of YhaV-PrlF toxin-antitoxin module
MQQTRTHMDDHGRILIPASLRKTLKYNKGDTFVLRVVNDELRVISLDSVLNETREFMKKYINPDVSLVDEFLEMRKQERELEKSKFKNHDH